MSVGDFDYYIHIGKREREDKGERVCICLFSGALRSEIKASLPGVDGRNENS